MRTSTTAVWQTNVILVMVSLALLSSRFSAARKQEHWFECHQYRPVVCLACD